MDNTVIIYTGDQGFMLGEHDYQDKRWMYEESICLSSSILEGRQSGATLRYDHRKRDYAPTMLDFAMPKFPRPFRDDPSNHFSRPARRQRTGKKPHIIVIGCIWPTMTTQLTWA